MKSKIIILVVLGVAIVGAVMLFQSNKNPQTPTSDQGEAREPSLIAGEVTKVESDKIYFKTTQIVAGEEESVKTMNEEKVALMTADTQLIKEDPLNHTIATFKASELKVGTRITVYYFDMNERDEYLAVKIVLGLSAEQYNVENLLKNLGQ